VTATTAHALRRTRAAWPVSMLLGAIAIVDRLPAFTASRAIVFDDGQYGVSVVDMRHGYAPYSGVFSSQGPLHFPLLYLGDLFGFRTLNAPRVAPLLAGVSVTVGVWAIARRLGAADHVAAVAAILVATTGTMIWTTGQITGDGVAAGLVVWAVWAGLAYRDDPALGRALIVGLFVGTAIAVKPLIGAALMPIAWWMWEGRRRLDHGAFALATAVAVWFATALPWGLGRVWDQSIVYHTDKGPEHSKLFQLGKLATLLVERDGVLLAALALGLVATVVGASRTTARSRDITVVATWAGAVALVLVFEKAMFANHVATIIVPLVILFALRPPPLRWLAIASVVFVPVSVVSVRNILEPRAYTGIDQQLVNDLETLPPGFTAISDDPGYVWRAGLYTPRLMNDMSQMRIEQRLLTTADVVAAAGTPQNCAAVIWTPRFGAQLGGLRAGLRVEGYTLAREYAPGRELWLRPDCAMR
jgi:Dolichyl-phosphate-mannose-protein mannosyltransferase